MSAEFSKIPKLLPRRDQGHPKTTSVDDQWNLDEEVYYSDLIALLQEKPLDAKYIKELLQHISCSIGDAGEEFLNNTSDEEVARILVEHELKVNPIDDDENTLLMRVLFNDLVVKIVLEYPVDINHQNTRGETALILAAESDIGRDVVGILLEHGAEPNIRDKNGLTAFMHAIATIESEEVITMLLTHGASLDDVNQVIRDKRIPRELQLDETVKLPTTFYNLYKRVEWVSVHEVIATFEFYLSRILKTVQRGEGWKQEYDKYMHVKFQREVARIYDAIQASNEGPTFVQIANNQEIIQLAKVYLPQKWLELAETTEYCDPLPLIRR